MRERDCVAGVVCIILLRKLGEKIGYLNRRIKVSIGSTMVERVDER